MRSSGPKLLNRSAAYQVMMARRPKRQFRRKRAKGFRSGYLKGAIEQELDLGTLAAKTLVGVLNSQTVNEKTFVSSIRCTWTLSEFTLTTNVGPILCGVAHGDYTDAEIEAWIENSTSWNQGDLISKEVSSRRIRRVGVFPTRDTGSAGSWSLNDGKPIRTKLGWTLITGQTLRFWCYNTGEASIATTDPDVQVEGHANLWAA